MSDKTKIEWTDATWNVVTGCTRVSPGCENCYIDWAPPFRIEGRHFTDRDGNRSHAIGSTTGVRLHPDRLDMPLRWKRPRRIFVCSLADLFHDDVPDEYIARVWATMALAPQHTFQVLTKRHGRMRSLLSSPRFADLLDEWLIEIARNEYSVRYPLPNVWVGVTVEDQARADLRIPALLDTPAAVRWLSCEPLLGPVDLGRWITAAGIGEDAYPTSRLDWVVVGGESGPNARPMHPEWARRLRDQCADLEIPFLFKQWGEWAPDGYAVGELPPRTVYTGDPIVAEWNTRGLPFRQRMEHVGKKAAGRELDGRTWDEYPGGAS